MTANHLGLVRKITAGPTEDIVEESSGSDPDNGPGEMLTGTVEVKKCQITEEVKRKNLERRMHIGG